MSDKTENSRASSDARGSAASTGRMLGDGGLEPTSLRGYPTFLPDPVEYELYSGTKGFPKVLKAAAKEFMNDLNSWAESIMQKILEQSYGNLKYGEVSLLGPKEMSWKFRGETGKILFFYTGELQFDGAELPEDATPKQKRKMKEQGILTQREMDKCDKPYTKYTLNLPTMAKLKADDGQLYDVRLAVTGSHLHKDSRTAQGRGRLLSCGSLLNHRCLDNTCDIFFVSTFDLLVEHKERLQNPQTDDLVTHPGQSVTDTEGDHSTTDEMGDEQLHELSDTDEESCTEDEFNIYDVLRKNDMVKHFEGDYLCDTNENYLPSFAGMIMSIRDCVDFEEATVDYGISTDSRPNSSETAYWRLMKVVQREYEKKCINDPNFRNTHEFIECSCHAIEYEEYKRMEEGGAVKEKLDHSEKVHLKENKREITGIVYPCPAGVACIVPRETPEERSQRTENEIYLVGYSKAMERRIEIERESIANNLATINSNNTPKGPLLAFMGFPSHMDTLLRQMIDTANERLVPFIEKMEHVHGYHKIASHKGSKPTQVPFNGDEDIPPGMPINITVGVLMPKQMISPELYPVSFDISKNIGPYKSAIVLLHDCRWNSLASFPHGCNCNVQMIHGEDGCISLDDYYDGDLVDTIRRPLSEEINLCAMDLVAIGMNMGIIPKHSELTVHKQVYSKSTNPIINGAEVHSSKFVHGTKLRRCFCVFPDRCSGWMFESVCMRLRSSSHIVNESEYFLDENDFKDTVESLNPHTLSGAAMRFSMTEEQKRLVARNHVNKHEGTPTYRVSESSVYSPNHEMYTGMKIDASSIIARREKVDIVGEKEVPSLHGSNAKMAASTPKRKIIPSVVPDEIGEAARGSGSGRVEDDTESDEALDDFDPKLRQLESPHVSSESDDEQIQSRGAFAPNATPETGKQKRSEEASPPEAPPRKQIPAAASYQEDDDVIILDDSPPRTQPRPSTPPRPATPPPRPSNRQDTGDVFVDLVDSPQSPDEAGSVDAIEGADRIDGAGPAAGSGPAQPEAVHQDAPNYATESDSDHGPDDEQAGAFSSVSAPVIHQIRKSSSNNSRPALGKLKKELIEQHVAKGVEIERLNQADYDELKVRIEKVRDERSAADTQLERIALTPGLDAARERALLRDKIRDIDERLKTLLTIEDRFDPYLKAVKTYRLSKAQLNKKHDAESIQNLINELHRYRFCQPLPGDCGDGAGGV